jgi:uncharacterized membrane protein
MKKYIVLILTFCLLAGRALAQIDLENINPSEVLGKVITIENGFSPKFFIANVQIPQISKVAEILGMKNNDEINRLFNTFRTGRTVFHIVSYTGAAISVYSLYKVASAAEKQNYQAALVSGIGAIGVGVAVKLLTKGAANKAVDIFNNTARRKIKDKLKDIFKIDGASQTIGIGLYAKL